MSEDTKQSLVEKISAEIKENISGGAGFVNEHIINLKVEEELDRRAAIALKAYELHEKRVKETPGLFPPDIPEAVNAEGEVIREAGYTNTKEAGNGLKKLEESKNALEAYEKKTAKLGKALEDALADGADDKAYEELEKVMEKLS